MIDTPFSLAVMIVITLGGVVIAYIAKLLYEVLHEASEAGGSL